MQPGLFTINPIYFLELSKNSIEILPDDFLAGNISRTLTKFTLNLNSLRGIPRCVFKTNASEAVFPRLEVLELRYNNIEELPVAIFNSTNWTSLKKLDLEGNNLSTITQDIFHTKFLSKLTYINLSYNNIKILPGTLLQSQYLQNLQEIYLTGNQISSIPTKFLKNQALQNLERIYFNRNTIKSFNAAMLPSTLHRLCVLNLAHNIISSIDKMVTKVLRNINRDGYNLLCKIDLSYNNLRIQETNFLIENSAQSQFNGINGMLNLSYNKISKFEETIFSKGLTSSNTRVTVPLDREWLDTRGNPLFSVVNLVKVALNIDLNNVDQAINRSTSLTSIELLKLLILIKAFFYSYACNCDMEKYLRLQDNFHFKQAMNNSNFLTDWNITLTLGDVIDKLKCGSPEHIRGKYLYQVQREDLQCEHSKCTSYKKCTCTETPFNNTLRINCTDTNITLMPFINQTSSAVEIYLGFNDIQELPILVASIAVSVQVVLLDLSYNYITNIPDIFFSQYPNIKHLNLAGNLLTGIPSIEAWRHMNKLHFLELEGNKFQCSCPGLQLKKRLEYLNCRMLVNIRDILNIRCTTPRQLKERVIYDIEDTLFGCPVLNFVLIFTLTLSLLLFLFVVMSVVYIFRRYIRLFLFVHFGWRFWYSYTKDETLYDVFISYSSKDSDWVIDQLMNPLETLNPPYNLCLHERDFLIGAPLCDNISKAIEGSKCTICVVSRNWLESDWCQFEFRMAHYLAAVEKKIRLLVILKEEIPKGKIKGELKFYMKTFTYLDSAHSLFWSRLLNDLPRPDGGEERKEKKQRDAIELM